MRRGGVARERSLFWGSLQPKSLGAGKRRTMPAAEKKKLVQTDGELGLTMDPSLLRGATADLLIKNRSEIFSSNVLSQKDLAQLHESTAIVSFLHDFFSHSWRTARLDKWAALLYLNAQAAARCWSLCGPSSASGRPRLCVVHSGPSSVTACLSSWGHSGVVFPITNSCCLGCGPLLLPRRVHRSIDERNNSIRARRISGPAEKNLWSFSARLLFTIMVLLRASCFPHLQVAGKQKKRFSLVSLVPFANALRRCAAYARLPIFGPS